VATLLGGLTRTADGESWGSGGGRYRTLRDCRWGFRHVGGLHAVLVEAADLEPSSRLQEAAQLELINRYLA
jgi:hypothetical protein